MKPTLEELEQLAGHLRFKIKRALHQDHFFDADKYEAELYLVNEDIKKLKDEEITGNNSN